MTELTLSGCRPEPLSSYLKAVGVLRIVADQLDAEARGCWRGDSFLLKGTTGRDGLLDFFATAWRPTPLVSPWNGGSGFKAEKNPSAVKALSWVAASTGPRLAAYREAVAAGRRAYAAAEAGGWSKRQVIESCRNWLPDEALAWLDASVVLTNDDEVFPPLLGTGGNDGRFDFTTAYMARLADVWSDSPAASSRSREWLGASLFDAEPTPLLQEAVGQFDPGAAGGVSASSTGSAAEGLVNPWDWLLCLEGALAFAGASARRLGATTRGRAAIPFTLGPAAVGYVTGSREEATRGELWTPLWSGWASAREVTRLLGEGRVEWRGAQAANGLDAARALADLGVDRGVSSFVRHALVSRNGLATLAVPVGRLKVHRRSEVPLTGQLDGWLGAVRRDGNAPAAVRTAMHRLETALFSVAVHGGRRRLQDVLGRAAELDTAVGRSREFRSRTRVDPLLRDLDGWFVQLDDGSAEFRLAAGFASLWDRVAEGQDWADRRTLGRLLRPLQYDDRARRLGWSKGSEEVAGFGRLPLLSVLADAHVRRGVISLDRESKDEENQPVGVQPAYDDGVPVPLGDVAALLRGDVDLVRLEELLAGLLRLDWAAGGGRPATVTPVGASLPRAHQKDVPAALVLLAPCYLSRGGTMGWRPHRNLPDAQLRLRAQPDWLPRLRAGQVGAVLQAAATRLRFGGVDLVAGHRPGLAASQMAALAYGVDGRALAAALLLRVHTSELTRALRRLAPYEDITDRTEETA